METTTEAIQDRVQGVLLGLAAGDRNGGPIRLALRLADSLIEQERFDPEDILRRYLAWWRSGGFDTGPVAARVFELTAAGVPAGEAPARVHRELGGLTAGCNPAHRAAPLAMTVFLSDETLPVAARQEAGLTHYDPLAGDVAAAVVALCRALVRGLDWSVALRRTAEGRSVATRAALLAEPADDLNRGGFAPEVLRAAVHFVGQQPHFAAALEAAIIFAGRANYCPVLVGAIGGARWGVARIPEQALAHCALLTEVRQRAEALAKAWSEAT